MLHIITLVVGVVLAVALLCVVSMISTGEVGLFVGSLVDILLHRDTLPGAAVVLLVIRSLVVVLREVVFLIKSMAVWLFVVSSVMAVCQVAALLDVVSLGGRGVLADDLCGVAPADVVWLLVASLPVVRMRGRVGGLAWTLVRLGTQVLGDGSGDQQENEAHARVASLPGL